MYLKNRKIALKSLFGSHNYNLNDEQSDYDYKYFIFPTFDDLYTGKMFSTSHIGVIDYDVHDIRKLVDLFWKANINFLEVLYSKEFACVDEIKGIIFMRDKIVTMNLPYLYSACKGMHFEKMKNLIKGTEGTKHLVSQYGYDTKQAMHAYRVLDFCIRFAETDFTDFEKALRYTDNEAKELLYIKNGKFSLDDFQYISNGLYEQFKKEEELYKSHKPDEETKEKLYNLVKKIIKNNLCRLVG